MTDPMHRFVLIRHSRVSHDVTTDLKRPLTPRGTTPAGLLAEELCKCLGTTDLLLVSPTTRAHEAVRPIRDHLEPADALMCEGVYNLDPNDILKVLVEDDADARMVVVVGHEPAISALAHILHDVDGDLVSQIPFGVPTVTAVTIGVPDTWVSLEPKGTRIQGIFTARERD